LQKFFAAKLQVMAATVPILAALASLGDVTQIGIILFVSSLKLAKGSKATVKISFVQKLHNYYSLRVFKQGIFITTN
jgi:hypothetical protein